MPRYGLKSLFLATSLIGVEAGMLMLVFGHRSATIIEPNLSLVILIAFGAVVGAVALARFHMAELGAAIGAVIQIAILCLKAFFFRGH
jgi:hypothetical protein